MDWPRARAILLVAFTVVNLILAYSIWGPSGLLPGVAEARQKDNLAQLRRTLLDRGLDLPVTVTVARHADSMRFLHVEFPPTPEYGERMAEPSVNQSSPPWGAPRPTVDPETGVSTYWPRASGLAAREIKLDNREQVIKAAEEYLQQTGLYPYGALFTGVLPRPDSGNLLVEYVQQYNGIPVYSGFVTVEVSGRGIEKVSRLWVIPTDFTEAKAKDVRPVGEALVRLAGRTDRKSRTIRDIQLGYYAGRPFTLTKGEAVNGWDTVPVWRITMENGDIYYINAFNLQWEE